MHYVTYGCVEMRKHGRRHSAGFGRATQRGLPAVVRRNRLRFLELQVLLPRRHGARQGAVSYRHDAAADPARSRRQAERRQHPAV